MNRKIFLSESEKNKILNMHKNAIKKEFLIESGDPPSPTPTPTPTSTLNPETPEQIQKYKNEWTAMTVDEKNNYIDNTLLPLVEKKLTDKISAKVDDLTKNVNLTLKITKKEDKNEYGETFVSSLNVILYGANNSFEYDFGNHSQVMTTYEGNPRYLSSYGEGPELSNEIFLGSSSIDSSEIGVSIMNELSGLDKWVYTRVTFFVSGGTGEKMTILKSIQAYDIPVGVKPYSTEDNPGIGYLYFDNTSKDCNNAGLSTDKLVYLGKSFDATKLFSVNEPVDKNKFVCLTNVGKHNYKIGNSNLTMSSPNFKGYLKKLKENNF
jgi:hypothetical protein